MLLSKKFTRLLAVTAMAFIGFSPYAFANSQMGSANKSGRTFQEQPTTITETTTTTSYTVSNRKVGTIGGRPYKPKIALLEGGIRKDVSVNGVRTESVIIVADEIAPLANAGTDGGDYYTNKPQALQSYAQDEPVVHVINVGRMNR